MAVGVGRVDHMLLRDAVHPVARPADVSLAHVVLTRFNVRMFRDQSGIDSRAALASWVQDRTRIFIDVCLPGMVRQTRVPDLWLIGVDGLHQDLVEPLAEVCAPYSWIRLVPQAEGQDANEAMQEPLRSSDWSAFTHVVTTRLDCDDALAVDYLQSADTYARSVLAGPEPPQDFWVSFPLGAQLVGTEFSLYIHNRSHFLSRVTSADQAAQGGSVLDVPHSRIFRHPAPVYTPMTSTPMWVQNVHGGNVLNGANPEALSLGPSHQVAALFGWHHVPSDPPPSGREVSATRRSWGFIRRN